MRLFTYAALLLEVTAAANARADVKQVLESAQ
jgi:hypothetical protein